MAQVPLIRPYITLAEVQDQFRDVFESGIFTRGKNVEAFANEIARYTGTRHAFLVTSATTAMSTCLRILNVGPGDEVVVSDFSFPASANVIEDVGAKPVFADVSLDTYNVTPANLERKITSKTRAVIFVDALGNPSGVTQIARLCRARRISLIEDAACAIGSSENGKKCGKIADLTCLSFHPRKLLTTGEGGAITTDNDDYAARLHIKLNHGGKPGTVKWDFVDYGYNYRMNEIQAVMGRVQLQKLDGIVKRRNQVRNDYVKALEPQGYKIQKVAPGVLHNVQSVVFTVPRHVERDRLIEYLKEHEIETTLGTYCLSGTTYFKAKYRDVQPNAAFLEANTLTLPCYDGVEWGRVAEAIARFK